MAYLIWGWGLNGTGWIRLDPTGDDGFGTLLFVWHFIHFRDFQQYLRAFLFAGGKLGKLFIRLLDTSSARRRFFYPSPDIFRSSWKFRYVTWFCWFREYFSKSSHIFLAGAEIPRSYQFFSVSNENFGVRWNFSGVAK